MYQKPSVPRSIGGVLDDAVQLYKSSFAKCWLPALLTSVAVTVLALYQLSGQLLAVPSGNAQEALAQSLTRSLQSLPISFLALAIEGVFYGIMIYIIVAVSRGESPPFGQSVTATMRRLPAMIGAVIVVGLIATLGFGVAFGPLMYVMVNALRPGGTPAAILPLVGPAVLVCLLLAIPVLYVLSRMQLFLVPLVTEPEGPLQSIATSWRLVGGNWWRTSTTVFVMGVIVYILMLVAAGIVEAVAALVFARPGGAAQVVSTVAVAGAIAAGVIRLVSAPLMAALTVVIYQDLRLRKGGGDLEARLGALPKG